MQLHAENIPSPYAGHGKYRVSGLWRHQTLKRLVQNEFYKGEAWALINKRQPREKGKRYGKVVIDHDNGMQLPDGTVPALLSPSDWQRAQEIVAGRRVHRRQVGNPEEVLLRGGIGPVLPNDVPCLHSRKVGRVVLSERYNNAVSGNGSAAGVPIVGLK
jgi:hypothetical protein